MTLQEITSAHEGYIDKETRKYQAEWERTRWLGAVQARTVDSKIQPADLMKFPWEGATGDGSDRKTDIEKIQEYRDFIKNRR